MPLNLKFISTNVIFTQKGKIREIIEMLSDMIINKDIEIEVVNKAITEIQGTADEVIIDKIRRASEEVPGIIIIEDTSLFFEAWKTLPGPYM